MSTLAFRTQDGVDVVIALENIVQLQTAPRMHYNFFGHMRFTGMTDVKITVAHNNGNHVEYHICDEHAHHVVSHIRYYFDVEYSHQVQPRKKLFEL